MKRDTINDDIAWDVFCQKDVVVTWPSLDEDLFMSLAFTLFSEEYRAGPVIGLETQIEVATSIIDMLTAHRAGAVKVLEEIRRTIQERGEESS